MAIPPVKAPTTPNRAVRGFTIGTGPRTPPVSSLATSPNQSSLETTPSRIQSIGVDSQSRTVSVAGLTQGQSATYSVTIPMLDLPSLSAINQPAVPQPGSTPLAKFISRPGDEIHFQVSMQVSNAIPGLALSHFTCVPKARGSGGQPYTGPRLVGGQPYSAFAVVCTIIVTATPATGTPAGTVTITANGTLTLQLA